MGLRVSPLRFRLETVGAFHVPEYKGALFRGGFGQYFREMVCVTRAPVCTGCPHLSSCPYSIVFETPVLPERFAVLRKYPNAPHPFVLVPPLDARTSLPAGTVLELSVTLIGRGSEYLPHFIQVLEGMGRDGRYGGRFRVVGVVSAVGEGRLVYDGTTRRFVGEAPLWEEEAAGPVRRMTVEFVTPLRMRTEGRYNSRPDFVEITQALLRRIHLLRELYGDESPRDTGWTRELLRQADRVETKRAEFRMYAWDRMSGRQGRRVQMDGVVGVLEAEGELTELARWWRLGEWVNVGSGTSMGLGRYRMRCEG